MVEYHEEFCASLCAILTSAWLPEDQWLVKEGRWISPRMISLASNAFSDRIGKRGVAFSNKGFEKAPKPFNSLLNRAKANRRTALPGEKLLGNMFLGSSRRSKTTALPGVVVPHDKDLHASIIQRKIRAHTAQKALARGLVSDQLASGNAAPALMSKSNDEADAPEGSSGAPLPPISPKTSQ